MKQISYTSEEFDQHIKREHKLSAFSTYLKEIVYGGVDGIVTTFAVVAGFAGAQNGELLIGASVATVLLFGLANLFADATSMGLGNILSVRADQDVYRREKIKEKRKIKNDKKSEIAETVHILERSGFSTQQAKDLAAIYSTNEPYWVDFMMNKELEMPNPEKDNPILTGISTAVSFMIFGAIPLLPYILIGDHPNIFAISIVSAATALILLGLLRLKVTNESILRSVGEIVALGGISATIAYLVGTFFR